MSQNYHLLKNNIIGIKKKNLFITKFKRYQCKLQLWFLNDKVSTKIIQYVSHRLVHSILLQDESLNLNNKSFFVVFSGFNGNSPPPLKGFSFKNF